MPRIELHTYIESSPEICFDLSRSVDLHLLSTAETEEKAIAGKTTGLMILHDTVTWRARHLGVVQNLTSAITSYDYPVHFVTEMQKGVFKKIYHQHLFVKEGTGTRMTDLFEFEAPLGIFGKFVCALFLTSYMKGFLEKRNQLIKEVAEDKSRQIHD
jgi:ligand-binding SRPBCC domain-containing protein